MAQQNSNAQRARDSSAHERSLRRATEPIIPLSLFRNRNFVLCSMTGPLLNVSFMGALFTMRLTADVAGKLPAVDNLSLATLTPQIVDALPASAQSVIAAGYSDALLPLFPWFVLLMLACLVMMLLLKRHPLATTINHGGAGR